MPYSIVNYSEVNGTFDFRIDGEYWHPKYLQVENKIENHKWSYLANIAKIKGGKRLPLGETFSEHGVPYIRAEDVKYFVDYERSPRISNELHQKLAQYQTQTNDILITIVGNSIGDVGFVKFDLNKCHFTENCAKLTDSVLLPDYIFLFLISKYGQNQIHREKVGTAQPKLALARIANFKVPMLGKFFQVNLQRVVTKSYEIWEQSKCQYLLSQTLLLSELGLTNWQPKHRLTFVKNYSDTEQAGRIDAEYYQPKYEEIERAIKTYVRGHTLIRDEFRQNKSTFKIDDEKLYRYVEIGSVNVANGEIIANEVLGKDLPANAKRVLQKGNVIISKVRTYRGAITIVDKNGYIGSGAFCVLEENGRINNETLLAFLHSKPLLDWSLKPNTGTAYPVIVDDDILNLPIPILPAEKQAQIQQKVVESFRLRKQSKHLLECAKRAVEIAIETDEQTAVDWLENETKDLNC